MSLRKLKKYRLEFQAIKEEEEREDPAEKLEVRIHSKLGFNQLIIYQVK